MDSRSSLGRMETGNMWVILFQQLVQSIGIGPHGIIGIAPIVGSAHIATLTNVLIFLPPVPHAPILLHHLLFSRKICILQSQMSVDCLNHYTIKCEKTPKFKINEKKNIGTYLDHLWSITRNGLSWSVQIMFICVVPILKRQKVEIGKNVEYLQKKFKW